LIDKEENHKKSEYQISARFKKMAIKTATEATTIAIGDTSNITHMEQHIKNLLMKRLKHTLPPTTTTTTIVRNEKTYRATRHPILCRPQKERGRIQHNRRRNRK
jgi:hypothetical protein